MVHAWLFDCVLLPGGRAREFRATVDIGIAAATEVEARGRERRAAPRTLI